MDKKIKTDGIILDIDGTIWDSTAIVAKAWNRAAREAGSLRSEVITADLLKTQFGKPMDEIGRCVFPMDTAEKRETIMELCCRYEHEELRADPCDVVFPGVYDTIKELSGRIKFYIVSNCQKGYIELVCEKTGLGAFITDFESFGNTGMGKADNIKELVKRNGLKNPVYIGDTEGDRIACEEAGVPFVHAAYGFGDLQEDGAAAVIDSFEKVKDIFE